MNRSKIVLACVLAGSMGSVWATTVTGDHFSLSGTAGQFGAMSASGNVAYFNPGSSPGFTAYSTDGTVTSSEDRSFSVQAAPGYQITGFTLQAFGNYAYFIDSHASVGVSGSITVIPVTSSLSTPAFAGYSSEIIDRQTWAASASTIGGTYPGAATVRLQMALTAFADPNDPGVDPFYNYAVIENRELQLTVTTAAVAVPEPPVTILMLAGLGAIGLVAGRRRRQQA